MATTPQLEKSLDKLARRCVYCLVVGVGAFFAYFNSIYGWVTPPEHIRIKGAWLKPFMPVLEPYLPEVVIVLGIGFLAYAVYS